MGKPVVAATHNSLRPHWKWQSVAKCIPTRTCLFLLIVDSVDQASYKTLNRWNWVRPSLGRGRALCEWSELTKNLILNESNLEYRCWGDFRNFFRMTSSDFEILLNSIGPIINKRDTKFAKAIQAHERLAVATSFLALMYMFKILKQAISSIIPNTCDALVNVLQDYIQVRK